MRLANVGGVGGGVTAAILFMLWTHTQYWPSSQMQEIFANMGPCDSIMPWFCGPKKIGLFAAIFLGTLLGYGIGRIAEAVHQQR